MNDVSATDALHILHVARAYIRSHTRPPRYFKYADRFSEMFLGTPLDVDPDYYKAVGTDAQIIDFYYEELLSEGEVAAPLLRNATRQLQEMATLSLAAAAMPALRARIEDSSCSLLDVACAFVAAITILGHDAVARTVSPTAADRWLALWQDYLSRQDRQQELHCGLCLLRGLSPNARSRVMTALDISPEALRPRSTSFAAGVLEYLTHFSETGAYAVVLIGGLPFAKKLTSGDMEELIDYLRTTPELLELMTGLIRFAPDVSFDQTEPINSGVFALAAETGVNVVDIDAGQVIKADVDEKLRDQWEVYSRECRRRADALLAAVRSREALHRALTDIADGAFLVAEQVTSAPHKGA